MSFGENLTNLRRQKGWSQDDLANNLDLSRQAISKWENETSKPDIDNIKKISKIFSIKIDELINNELPDDKAVTLDVKKEEKREKTITIIKLMIIAVIILYVISVIYKFASLLVIVNGVQKYANLNNYHYVITTYENNEFTTKEEYWYKDGVSKKINTIIQDKNVNTITTSMDLNEKTGTVYDKNNNYSTIINVDEYLNINPELKDGGQMFYQLPDEIRKKDLIDVLIQAISFNKLNIEIKDNSIGIIVGKKFIMVDKETLLPIFLYQGDSENKNITKTFRINLNYA